MSDEGFRRYGRSKFLALRNRTQVVLKVSRQVSLRNLVSPPGNEAEGREVKLSPQTGFCIGPRIGFRIGPQTGFRIGPQTGFRIGPRTGKR